MDRRTFTQAVGLGVSGTMMAAVARGADTPRTTSTAPYNIGMIVFDNMTALDFIAPQDAFNKLRAAKVHVLAKSRGVVATDTGLKLTPDLSLDEAPELDLIFIGGGAGTTQLMEDNAMLDFLQQRAPRAQWITSVCTGALVLGAAGLLRGYKAATHWAFMEVLPVFGAEPVHERVVFDRNRITGGGVTSGLDFGLAVAAKLYGDDLAQLIQLGQEYDPKPPFNAGSPRTAPPAIVQQFRGQVARSLDQRMAAARRAAAKFGAG